MQKDKCLERQKLYYKALGLPTSGNSREQTRRNRIHLEIKKVEVMLNDDNLIVKLVERPRKIQNPKRKVLHHQKHQVALGSTFTELKSARVASPNLLNMKITWGAFKNRVLRSSPALLNQNLQGWIQKLVFFCKLLKEILMISLVWTSSEVLRLVLSTYDYVRNPGSQIP